MNDAAGEPKLHVLLCDKATSNPGVGTLNLLNAGFSVATPSMTPSGPVTAPQTVAIFYEVPLDWCNRDLPVTIELIDDDGRPVSLPGPGGLQPLQVRQTIRVAPVAGAPTGSPGFGNLLLELGPPGLPLPPGRWYFWRVSLGGSSRPDWQAGFWVPAAGQPPSFGSGPSAIPPLS